MIDEIAILALKKSGAVDVSAAVAAKEAAQAAQEAAETAQEAAETAQGKAEDAAEELEQTVEDVAELKTDVSSLLSQIISKAETNGEYDEMTVGSASQLLSAKGVTDKVPYLFRRSGGAGANRAKETAIVGGTIAWNQMSAISTAASATVNGVTFTNNNDGTLTVNGTASETASLYTSGVSGGIKAGHVYVLRGCPAGGSASTYSLHLAAPTDYGNGTIFKAAADAVPSARIDINSGYTASNLVFKLNTHDLTAALTPAIADYIFSLEQVTPGAGMAKLRSWGLCVKDYYSYDAGSLQSVQVAGKAITGFNQWDEEWEVGNISLENGQNASDNTRIRSKNYIPVLSGDSYYCIDPTNDSNVRFFFYDAEHNFIGYGNWVMGVFTTPASAHYMRFIMGMTYGTTYKNDICINLSDPTRNGEYAPYESHTYPLDSTLTLRGIPELDADNNLRYNGDVYSPDGTVERRFGVVDLGTLAFEYNGAMFFTDQITDIKRPPDWNTECIWLKNTKYTPTLANNVANGLVDKAIAVQPNATRVIFRDTAYSDAVVFKAAMSGVYLVYELATPTTETADPYQETQLLDPYGTEEFIDAAVTASTPTRDVAIPVGHETYYPENASEKLAGLPWDFSTLIANTEKGFTATKPYSVNDFLIIDNQLYRVTVSIANGATITPNTNVTATTIGAQITALLNA